MTNERLEHLRMRAARAETLVKELESLRECQHEGDRHNIDYVLRCETHRLGREAAIKSREAELESLLGNEEVSKPTPPPMLDMGVQIVPSEAIAP